jgi:hypothetical protein
MAALKLNSLVLRGVAVLSDSVNVVSRRGASYKAGHQTPEIPFSMRHLSQGQMQEPFGNPASRPDHVIDVVDTDLGAGRSLGLAGVLRRGASACSTATCLSSLATTATTAGREAWCKPASRALSASTWGRGTR